MLTKCDQELLVEIFNNKGSITSMDGQSIFLTNAFYESITKLSCLRLVGTRNNVKDKRKKTYFLTDAGIVFGHILSGNQEKKVYLIQL